VMIAPQVRDVAQRLGLQTRPRSADYDVAVIGGGPRATSLPSARCSRHGGSARKSWSRARSPASIRRRAKFLSTAAT
jgi:hypothetical protein